MPMDRQSESIVVPVATQMGAIGGGIIGGISGAKAAMIRYTYSMDLSTGKVTLLRTSR